MILADRRRGGRAWIFAFALAGMLSTSCTVGTGEQNKALTQRERDSTIAASPLPGASTVGKALEVADSAAARRQRPLPDAP